jgi:hypothetical protein
MSPEEARRQAMLKFGNVALVSEEHELCEGRLTQIDAKLQQFAVNPRRAPEWVRVGHCANQYADIARYGRPADAMTSLPPPQQAEALAMPRDHGVRLHDDERAAPVLPEPRDPDPQQAVGRSETEALRILRLTLFWSIIPTHL